MRNHPVPSSDWSKTIHAHSVDVQEAKSFDFNVRKKSKSVKYGGFGHYFKLILFLNYISSEKLICIMEVSS